MKSFGYIHPDESPFRDEASGCVSDPLTGLGDCYSEITHIHVSDRNVVYRAKRFGRLWILKGVNPDNPSTAATVALRKELEIMMLLHHPSVAVAFALEQVDDLGECLVMEYAGDITLGEWLESHPAKSARRRAAHRILDALAYIHSRGVVHRDIKPSNIIVSEVDEQIKIIDFGMADTTSHTIFKAPAGTAGYTAPDQSDDEVPDVADDIYSAGRVLALLDCGFGWKRVAAACKRGKKRRPRSVESLLRLQRFWHRLPIAAGMLLAVVALVWSIGTVATREPAVASPAPVTVAAVPATATDSLSALRIDSLNRALALARDSVQTLIPEATASRHQEAVDKAVDKGIEMIDRQFDATAMHYLDTVDPTSPSVYEAYPLDGLNAMTLKYSMTLGPDFTEVDGQAVYNALLMHLYERIQEWNKRREKLISRGSAAK